MCRAEDDSAQDREAADVLLVVDLRDAPDPDGVRHRRVVELDAEARGSPAELDARDGVRLELALVEAAREAPDRAVLVVQGETRADPDVGLEARGPPEVVEERCLDGDEPQAQGLPRQGEDRAPGGRHEGFFSVLLEEADSHPHREAVRDPDPAVDAEGGASGRSEDRLRGVRRLGEDEVAPVERDLVVGASRRGDANEQERGGDGGAGERAAHWLNPSPARAWSGRTRPYPN